jgi:hypothetical protein
MNFLLRMAHFVPEELAPSAQTRRVKRIAEAFKFEVRLPQLHAHAQPSAVCLHAVVESLPCSPVTLVAREQNRPPHGETQREAQTPVWAVRREFKRIRHIFLFCRGGCCELGS